MAQLVVAAAGAALGGFIAPGIVAFGMSGASLGWMAGSMIGSAFAPTQKSSGPQLSDLAVSTSAYGTPIPYVQGHPRVSGQIVWASAKREIATTTEQGKGGGGSEYTSYTYEVDLLILLTDNPIGGVRRVWSNGKLVWSSSDLADAGTISSSVLAPDWKRITPYGGEPTQLPDPTYEAAVGMDNAPAYRGRGSVFIESLQLGGSGQLPNLTFEVTSDTGTPLEPGVVIRPFTGEAKYLAVDDADFSTARGALAYDDSGWSSGAGPFGNLPSSELPMSTLPPANTAFTLFSNFWTREVVSISEYSWVRITIWSDNLPTLYLNGVATPVSTSGFISVHTFRANAGDLLIALMVNDYGLYTYSAYQLSVLPNVYTAPDAVLSTVVTDLCQRSGLPGAKFDVTALATITKPVRSMAISSVSSARTVLDMLASSYHFEAVLSDKIYFRPRASAPAATLTFNELGVVVDSASTPDPLPLTQANELEIPAQMALTYSNVDGDYQTDTQYSDRLLSGQESTSAMQLPLGFTSSEAKQIVDAMLLDKAVSALTTSVSLGLTRAALEPTDVVLLTGEDGSSYRMRIVKKAEASGATTFDCVQDDATVFVQSGTTSGGTAPQTTVGATVATTLEVLDIPLLRDVDNVPGHYVAVKGNAAGWQSAALYVSTDNTTFTQNTSINSQAVMGACTSTLANYTGTGIDTSTLTVSVGLGQLSSVTEAAMLASESVNLAVVGSELVQFQTATLVSAGVYTLTNFKRGARGTEWARAGHAASERFVLLSNAGVRFVTLQASDIGSTRYYKGVSAGQKLSDVTAKTLAFQSVNLKPFAPTGVARSTVAGGGSLFTWTRRDRLSSVAEAASPPMSEASESYDVEVFDGANVLLASATVSSPSYTFLGQLSVSSGVAGTAISFMQKIGSDYFGTATQAQLTKSMGLRRLSTSGALLETSGNLGELVLSAAYSGAVAYVATSDTSGGFFSNSKIHRLTTSPIAVSHTFVASASTGEVTSIAHDGAHLWAAYANTSALVKLDGATLAVLSTTTIPTPKYISHSGGYLYIVCDRSAQLIKWNCATNTEVWRITTPAAPFEVLQSGTILVLTSVLAITVYDASTGAYKSSTSSEIRPQAPSYTRHLYSYGGQVVAFCMLTYSNVSGVTGKTNWTEQKNKPVMVLMNSTTGAVEGVTDLPALTNNISGTDGTALITSLVTITSEYNFSSSAVSTSVSGGRVKVYQKSALVGRGYPAELVL